MQATTNGNLVNNDIPEKLGLALMGIATFVAAFAVAFAVQWKVHKRSRRTVVVANSNS